MIIIIGYPRTGSSILFKSLKNAGFNGGKNLGGHKYPSEDRYFKNLIESIIGGYFETDIISEKLADEISNFFSGYCKENGIEILKYPWLWRVFKTWVRLCPEMIQSKFIWTKRNPLECARSYMRMADKRRRRVNNLIGYKFTTSFVLDEINRHNELVEKYLNCYSHITVRLESMLEYPQKTFGKISDYVGRYVSPELIDPQQTYAVNGGIN